MTKKNRTDNYEFLLRKICRIADIDFYFAKNGLLSNSEWSRFTKAKALFCSRFMTSEVDWILDKVWPKENEIEKT